MQDSFRPELLPSRASFPGPAFPGCSPPRLFPLLSSGCSSSCARFPVASLFSFIEDPDFNLAVPSLRFFSDLRSLFEVSWQGSAWWSLLKTRVTLSLSLKPSPSSKFPRLSFELQPQFSVSRLDHLFSPALDCSLTHTSKVQPCFLSTASSFPFQSGFGDSRLLRVKRQSLPLSSCSCNLLGFWAWAR